MFMRNDVTTWGDRTPVGHPSPGDVARWVGDGAVVEECGCECGRACPRGPFCGFAGHFWEAGTRSGAALKEMASMSGLRLVLWNAAMRHWPSGSRTRV